MQVNELNEMKIKVAKGTDLLEKIERLVRVRDSVRDAKILKMSKFRDESSIQYKTEGPNEHLGYTIPQDILDTSEVITMFDSLRTEIVAKTQKKIDALRAEFEKL